jgi:hypothetical protein
MNMNMNMNISATAIAPNLLFLAPMLTINLNVKAPSSFRCVHGVLLRARIAVHAAAHAFTPRERDRLAPLFGSDPAHWARSTRSPVPFADVSVATGRFEGSTNVDLNVPCSSDLGLATTKLFNAIDEGSSLPLSLLFSGTIFGEDCESGAVTILPIPSDVEARIDLSVDTWRRLMKAHTQ